MKDDQVFKRDLTVYREGLLTGRLREAERRATPEMLDRVFAHWRVAERRQEMDRLHGEALLMDDVVFPHRVLRFR